MLSILINATGHPKINRLFPKLKIQNAQFIMFRVRQVKTTESGTTGPFYYTGVLYLTSRDQ